MRTRRQGVSDESQSFPSDLAAGGMTTEGGHVGIDTGRTDLPFIDDDTVNTVSGSTTKRLNVNFTEEAYDEIARMARDSGQTISDIVRQAISLKRWHDQRRREGWRILIERDGRQRELLPF